MSALTLRGGAIGLSTIYMAKRILFLVPYYLEINHICALTLNIQSDGLFFNVAYGGGYLECFARVFATVVFGNIFYDQAIGHFYEFLRWNWKENAV